jgi:hypothetical protein
LKWVVSGCTNALPHVGEARMGKRRISIKRVTPRAGSILLSPDHGRRFSKRLSFVA